MAKVLFLVHRLPYPPNKGDKVRSYHLLRHLAAQDEVFLGTFVDDPDDEQHLPAVRALCAEVHAVPLAPGRARLRSLRGLLGGDPLTLPYYADAGLAHWIAGLLRRQRIDRVLVFSSSMAQYAEGFGGPVLVDFVDVDSAKWTDYARARRWPLSWIYGREGRTLLAYERRVAARAKHAFFATEKEAALFRTLAPECADRVSGLSNGVDAEFFSPHAARPTPFRSDELPLVFTGAMDYWPNVDAVCWFVREVLPGLRRSWPALRFHIVGRSPVAAVRELAGPAVSVSGTVPDVRPYLQHAAVVVAPLRLARGIQNKVLEAMAMARPVVAAAACVEAIDVTAGLHLLAATDAQDFVRRIGPLLSDPALAAGLGAAGRARVLEVYGWEALLQGLDRRWEPVDATGLRA
jgi:sugar transferase (PEP-CTERM/EpsH1 system associated)